MLQYLLHYAFSIFFIPIKIFILLKKKFILNNEQFIF